MAETRLRPASRGSAKPAPMTVRRTDVSGAPPAQSGLRCSRCASRSGADQRSAFPCLCVACAQSGLRRSPRCAGRCRPEVGVPVPVRRLCSIRTAPLAPLRGAVPTRGRRSLACASLVLNRDCAVRPPAAGCADQRSAFPCLRATEPVGAPAEMRRPASARRSRRALKVRGENPPFHTFPRTRLAANEVRCRWFFARSGERRQPQAGGWDSPPNSGMAPTAARTSACTVAPRPVALRILLIHKHPRGSSGREPQRGQVTRPAIFGNPNRGALPYSLPLAPSRRGRPGSLASCLAERRFPVVCCSWVRWRPDSSSAEWFR